MRNTVRSLRRVAASIPNLPQAATSSAPTFNYDANSRTVKLDWQEKDLHQALFPVTWLRDVCQSPHSVDPRTRQKTFRTSDIPADLRPESISVTSDNFHIKWNCPLNGYSDATRTSTYPVEFLKRYAYGHLLDRWLCRNIKPVLWNRGSLTANSLVVPYSRLEEHHTKVATLMQLQKYGIVFLTDVPTSDKSEENCELVTVARSFGQIRKTWYGLTFDVKAIGAQAKNVAYTNLDLGLHMDLVHFEDPPRIQMLHFLHRTPSLKGGQSYFVDSYAAAEKLRSSNPDAFDVLCRNDIAFEYNNDGHARYFERPTIELDAKSNITAVNYSPPFQAPLPLSNKDGVDIVVDALRHFARLLDDPENRFAIDMQPGELVAFDNRRVLHARTSFTYDESAEEVGRWLKGCYVEGDSVLDTLRVLRQSEVD